MNTAVHLKPRTLRLNAAISILACAGLAFSVRAHAAGEAGWYTRPQATQGHQLFNNYCAQCHRPDLSGAAGPALIGSAFLQQWEGKPLGDLYNFEHSNMPADNPGSVPADRLWNITAYILQKNGFPAGTIALSQTTATSRMLMAR